MILTNISLLHVCTLLTRWSLTTGWKSPISDFITPSKYYLLPYLQFHLAPGCSNRDVCREPELEPGSAFLPAC